MKTFADVERYLSGQLGVSRETIDRLSCFVAEIEKWTPRINLISKRSLDQIWTRHIADSAQLSAVAGNDWRKWVDLGSGGGLPGVVVSILSAEQADRTVLMVESDARKCLFLEHVVRLLGLNSIVCNTRIEDLETSAADIVSARALAPLNKLLEYSAPLLGDQALCIFPKGKTSDEELTIAREYWSFDSHKIPSVTDPDATVLRISKVTREK